MYGKFKKGTFRAFKKIQDVSQKAKIGAVVATGSLVTGTNSFGAVTYDAATKTFSGDIELGAYYSVIPIVIGVIGSVIAVTLAIGAFRKAK